MERERIALTVEQAAAYTGIGRNTMRQLIEWKVLPVLKVGRKILIPTVSLAEFLQANQNVNLRNRAEIHPVYSAHS